MSALDNLWSKHGFLSFPIDCDAVLKHLKQDMRDDWFADVLGYRDLFAQKADLQKVLAELLAEGNGQYLGEQRQLCDVPKKGLGLRYALETDFYDRFVYQAICSFLIKYYDPLLSTRVFGHRWNPRDKNGRYLFKSRIELWQTFEGITYASLAGEEVLLATDLINYFENISIEMIKEAFLSKIPSINASGQEKLQIRNSVLTLCALLERWSYSDRHGLPQNRDASSFIANVVLSGVDHKMVELGYDYFRYVDDIRIVCSDSRRARKALSELIAQLRVVGMNINSSKTAILEAVEDERVSEFFPAVDSRTLAIDGMWKSRSRRVIARSVPLVCKMISELIEAGDSQSRQFRFAVNRMKILLESDIFIASSSAASGLVALVLDALETQAVSTDQFCRILSLLDMSPQELRRVEAFLLDSVVSIHSWQNYHLWMLLALKKYESDAIIDLARRKVSAHIRSPEVPAIFVYLSVVGKGEDVLEEAILSFASDWPFQHQRYLLLATKDFGRESLSLIYGKVGVRFRGTVRRARSHIQEAGTLVRLPEALSLLSIYDEISVYD